MKKIVLFLTLVIVLFCTSITRAEYGPYGGPEEGDKLLVDKLVAYPVKDGNGNIIYQYVDNLGASDYRFSPLGYVFFKVKVKNVTDKTITNITLVDTFPSYLEIFEDTGIYDASKRTITIKIDKLEPNEEKVFTLKARVLASGSLPADKSLLCLINNAKATATNAYDDDNSQFCIEKRVLGATTPSEIPSTGAETLVIIGLSSLLSGIGITLKKNS